MTERNRVIEGKKERQRTMDKLSIISGLSPFSVQS